MDIPENSSSDSPDAERSKGFQINFEIVIYKPKSILITFSGADKSRFWPNRALWGASMKLGTIMVKGMLRKIGRGHRL